MIERPVVVVVLCWNRWELTERCLASLARHTTRDPRVEILVVDNGSTDETPERLRTQDGVKVLRNQSNLGFVRGNNAGMRAAGAETDIVLLNNDTEIISDGWVEDLQRTAYSAADIGVVGCRMVGSDGRLLHAGTYILPDTCWGQQIGSLETDVNQYGRDREVQGIVFACAYLKREVIASIGLLSEDYESYFEDTDYCLRAREAGFRTYCCGGLTLVHHEHGSTADAPQSFSRLFERSRQAFRRRWESELEQAYTHTLSWQSILNVPTGYAMSSRSLLTALETENVRVSYSYVYGRGSPMPLPEPEDTGDYRLNIIRGRRRERRPAISVVYGQGDVFERNRGRYRIGYTMLEVDGFPAEWVRQANQMDEVWTPTEFNREALIRCGVRRPVYVMPLGVDIDRFHPGVKSFPSPDGDFVFLANLEWGERKAPEILLQVFNHTFRATEPVALICKVNNRDPGVDVRRQIEAMHLRSAGGRIALLHNRELPYHQLASLYRSADCFVSAGRGEGWDMPLMEAMACGVPAIATDWGAHRQFVHHENAYLLRVRGTVDAVARCPYYNGFSWADPDPDHLAELLRAVYERRDEAREVGRRAAAEMVERWSWARAARRIKQRIATITAR